MNSPDVLMPLNNYLTIKSAARMRATCKCVKWYIKVKDYSYYPIFKKLKIDHLSVIKALLSTDPGWLDENSSDDSGQIINYHKHGFEIKKYIENTQFYMCIMEFKEKLDDELIVDDGLDFYIPGQTIEEHCNDYTDYYPLYEILITMCYDLLKEQDQVQSYQDQLTEQQFC
jgi:hypothetical protein